MKDKITKFFGIRGYGSYGSINIFDVLKFLAISFMIVDHVGHFFLTDEKILRALGRLAFPIFLFVVGYSKSFRASYNILILGIIVTVYSYLFLDKFTYLDILVTIFITRLLLQSIVKSSNSIRVADITVIFVSCSMFYLPTSLLFSYGSLAFVFGFLGLLARNYVDSKVENELRGQGQGRPFTPSKAQITSLFFFCVVINFLLQSIAFGEQNNLFYAVFMVVSLLLYLLFMFSISEDILIRKFTTSSKFCDKIVILTSRNALFIYFAHHITFTIIRAVLGV